MPDAAFGGEGGQAFGDNGAAFQVAENNPRPATSKTWDANARQIVSTINTGTGADRAAADELVAKTLDTLRKALAPINKGLAGKD